MYRFPLLLSAFLALATSACLAGSATIPRPAAPTPDEKGSVDQYIRENTSPAYLVIVGTSKDFPSLRHNAERIAPRLRMHFSMLGQVYDQKQGLHSTGQDDGFTGYFHRRYDDADGTGRPVLTIEESASYPGLKPGFYIIVAHICGSSKEAHQQVKKCRHVVPSAYAKRTEIYYGCIH